MFQTTILCCAIVFSTIGLHVVCTQFYARYCGGWLSFLTLASPTCNFALQTMTVLSNGYSIIWIAFAMVGVATIQSFFTYMINEKLLKKSMSK